MILLHVRFPFLYRNTSESRKAIVTIADIGNNILNELYLSEYLRKPKGDCDLRGVWTEPFVSPVFDRNTSESRKAIVTVFSKSQNWLYQALNRNTSESRKAIVTYMFPSSYTIFHIWIGIPQKAERRLWLSFFLSLDFINQFRHRNTSESRKAIVTRHICVRFGTLL